MQQEVQTDNSPAFQFDFQNPNTPPPVETHPDSLADGFLKEVDPAHREIVEPYVKQWDGQVTRRFQSIHEQYKPYKELGVDVSDLQGAWQIAQAFNDDPVGTLQKVFQLYREQGIELDMSDFFENNTPQEPAGQQQTPIPVPTGQENTGGLPPEIMEKLSTIEGVVGALAQQEIERRQAQENEQNRKQFDDYLTSLHNTHGDFDNNYVASRMATGMDAETAIKEFKDMVQSYANSQRNNPAPNFFQGGNPPGQVQAVDPSKLTPEQRREYVAARLSQPS